MGSANAFTLPPCGHSGKVAMNQEGLHPKVTMLAEEGQH